MFAVPEQALIIDAILEAQRAEAYALDPADVRETSDLQARVDLAVAQLRAGDLEAAQAQSALVLSRLRQSPHLPGVSSMAWALYVLRGRISWTQADDAGVRAAFEAAVALDPQARLSTRKVPPDVAEAYETIRLATLDAREDWAAPTLRGMALESAHIEIDGVAGMRPVPPGEHFVVVRFPGAQAQAAAVGPGGMVVDPPQVDVPSGLPTARVQADEICDRLDLEVLVLARVRDGRVGVQAHTCGAGFSDPWYSLGALDDEDTWQALDERAWGSEVLDGRRGVLLDAEPWPRPEPPPRVVVGPTPRDTKPTTPPPKPWFRRAWVWVVVGTVVVGAVTTGAVLGTREPTSSVIVTDDFLNP